MQRCRGKSGSLPELRIDPALLDQGGVEGGRLLIGPGAGEVIEVMMKLAAGGGVLPRGVLQHTNHHLVEAQAVGTGASAYSLLELLGGMLRRVMAVMGTPPSLSPAGCITACSKMHHSRMHGGAVPVWSLGKSYPATGSPAYSQPSAWQTSRVPVFWVVFSTRNGAPQLGHSWGTGRFQ